MELRISGPVRRAFGARNADALRAGIGLPPEEVQCYGCGSYMALTGPFATRTVNLSVVQVSTVHITCWSHLRCGASQIFTPEEFEQVTAHLAKPRPVDRLPAGAPPALHSAILVEGREPIIVTRDQPA
jgi:hypothetical protein